MIRGLLDSLAESPHQRAWFWFSLHHDCGYCPGGCRIGGLGFPTGRVYRSSRRSLTMQCTKCHLQWTMTVHRIAQAVARKAESEPRPERDLIARMWAEWANDIDDQRGRRSRAPSSDEQKVEQ